MLPDIQIGTQCVTFLIPLPHPIGLIDKALDGSGMLPQLGVDFQLLCLTRQPAGLAQKLVAPSRGL